MKLALDARDQIGVVDALELLGRLAAEQDSNKEAIRLRAGAESRRTILGYRFAIDRYAHDGALTKVKQKLGEDDFVAAWAEGARVTADEAIA